MWLLATLGVAAEMLRQLIPWSLGWSATVDPVLARMLFWWFGHPLVYFWLLRAYVVWYGLLPPAAGGKLFSEPLGRVVFAMFVLLSTPVGFHHQFMDPGVSASWKPFHTFNWLTNLSAIGGMVLFASALFFVLVMLFTLFGPRVPGQALEFSEPLEDPGTKGAFLDRLGLLTALAAALIVIAYAYPIWQHLRMPRFGSPGFSPF